MQASPTTDDAPPWVPDEERQTPAASLFAIDDLGAILARVDAAPPPAYLIRGVMAGADYGMFAAEFKAGKTWAMTDLAVSVASSTPWLGMFEVDAPGPVLLFAGEGGERKIARRFRAVCESRGIDPSGLPIRVCLRVPHLTSAAAMCLVEEEIAQGRPKLVIIDPLYLAARGAKGSDLYEMGAHLEGAQAICQRHGAALLIAHHWNKTGEGRGAKRMSGAGPDAWGRVLISAAKVASHTDPSTLATTVTLELDFQGDEIAERTVRIRRKVWADDPNDISSALHYEVEQLDNSEAASRSDDGLRPSHRRVLNVLIAANDWRTRHEIQDALASDDTGLSPLKTRTIQDALARLGEVDLVEPLGVLGGQAGKWRISAHVAPTAEVVSDF